MPVTQILRGFLRDESGAVTVDWVVITAAIVGLAIAVTTIITGSTADYSETIGSAMSSKGIASY